MTAPLDLEALKRVAESLGKAPYPGCSEQVISDWQDAREMFARLVTGPTVLALLARVEAAEKRAGTLFDAIAHGDDEHRAWLKDAIEKHFAGQEVPRSVGQGSAEKARAAGFREGVAQAACIAVNGCLVPPDGGSPTEEERTMCESIAARIRALASRDEVAG